MAIQMPYICRPVVIGNRSVVAVRIALGEHNSIGPKLGRLNYYLVVQWLACLILLGHSYGSKGFSPLDGVVRALIGQLQGHAPARLLIA